MADVSVDALQKVKSALSTFQSDIAGISLRASNQSQNCLNACRQKVDETQAKIEELESAITKLNNKIETLDGQISSALSQIQQLENAIPQMERRLRSIEMEISSLQQQLSALQAQLADAEDDDTPQQIQSQINMVTQQLQRLHRRELCNLQFIKGLLRRFMNCDFLTVFFKEFFAISRLAVLDIDLPCVAIVFDMLL